MNRVFRKTTTLAAIAVLAFVAMIGVTWAATGQPQPWEMNLQPPVTEVARHIHRFHELLLWITGGIMGFVTLLLAIVFVRFNRKANPVPSTRTHNTLLEVLWTGIPILILVVMAVPSFKLLYLESEVGNPDITIKATGSQWYWSYEYPDEGGMSFDSILVKKADLKPGEPRLLDTDNHVVVPVGKKVRVLVTATDVIHSWAVPSFGVKIDAVPGRINETWFKADKIGRYYGECSELCGVGHAYMPIVVDVVSEQQYQAWLVKAKKQFASDSRPTIAVAALTAHPVE